MTAQSDEERLLSILHAHGQEFLRAFDVPIATTHVTKDSHDSEEEWMGLSSSTPEIASDGEHDDEFTASSSCTPGITVFLEPAPKRPVANLSAKELRKSFMSSKVSSITTQLASQERIPKGESDDELCVSSIALLIQAVSKGFNLMASTNTQNDALLHRLVHTKLLSGSLNPELALDHAQRGRALVGRVLELAGQARLGKGEGVLRQEQRNKAAKRVRDGLIRKQREQEQEALEEAKNMGNYHPTLKRLYDPNPSSAPKKRARGLRMGVGKFVRGTLRLSREEIASVTGSRIRLSDNGRRTLRQRTR